MKFEFDPEKSKSNLAKYGITLDEACELWQVLAVEIQARTVDEPRWMIIGKLR